MSTIPSPSGFDELPDKTKNLVVDFFSPAQSLDDVTWTNINNDTGTIIHFEHEGELRTAVMTGPGAIPTSVTAGDFKAIVAVTDAATPILITSSTELDAADYFRSLVDKAITGTSEAEKDASTQLNRLIDAVVGDEEAGQVVRVIGEGGFLIKAESDTALALNLNLAENPLILDGFEKVVVIGSGDVQVYDDVGVTIAGDWRDQRIIGSSGDDTIIHSGGYDLFTGGAGNDTFIFSGGKDSALTIMDFSEGDTLMFNLPGASNIEELKAMLWRVDEPELGLPGSAVIAYFNDGSSLALINVKTVSEIVDSIAFM